MTINRLGFAYNPTSEDASELRERAAGWCRMRGVEHWAAPAGETATLVEHLPGTDVLVVLGGDGTFLRAAQAVTEVDVPLLGINLGKVGFLSKAEAHELEAVLGQLAAGTFVVRERMGLTGAILPAGRPGDTRFTALNDIVVARGSLARVVQAGRDDRRVAPGDVRRGRPGRREPHRLHGLLVLGRRPDPGPAEPQPRGHADRGLPVLDPVDRGLAQPGRAGAGARRARGARLDRRARGPPDRGRRRGGGPGAGATASGSWSRTARCRSGTSCGRRSSCCRPDDGERGCPPEARQAAGAGRRRSRPDRSAAPAARGRVQRADRRDRRRQEPADRRARPGHGRARGHDARPARGAERACRGAVRPVPRAAHRRAGDQRERAVHGAPRRRVRHGRAARPGDQRRRRDPRPARPAAAPGRGLATGPARRVRRARRAANGRGRCRGPLARRTGPRSPS